MSSLDLPDELFNRFTTISEREAREDAIRSDAAFVAAMAREIKRGRIRASAGTFVDTSPNIAARRIVGEILMSPCGSPAAMCVEATAQASGAVAMK